MANIWMPDYPPASADDKDDEFSDSSLSGDWTEFDPTGNITITETDYGLSMVQTSAANNNWGGLFKAVPAGDWMIWTKLSVLGIRSYYHIAGLVLGQDLTNNPSTSDLITFHLSYNDSSTIRCMVQQWNSYSSWNSTKVSNGEFSGTGLYLRIRKSDTTYSFDASRDGVGWAQLYSSTLAFTPAEFGLAVNNAESTGVTHRAVFQFFRCVDGTPSLTDVMNGKRVM